MQYNIHCSDWTLAARFRGQGCSLKDSLESSGLELRCRHAPMRYSVPDLGPHLGIAQFRALERGACEGAACLQDLTGRCRYFFDGLARQGFRVTNNEINLRCKAPSTKFQPLCFNYIEYTLVKTDDAGRILTARRW